MNRRTRLLPNQTEILRERGPQSRSVLAPDPDPGRPESGFRIRIRQSQMSGLLLDLVAELALAELAAVVLATVRRRIRYLLAEKAD